MDTFGERIKELRKAAGITQTGLAEKLNLHPQTVSKWERGISEPDISQLGDLAEALGITLEKLCGQEEAEQTFTGGFQAERFGKMVSEQRILRGESQERLAEQMQTSADTVSRWERGITCPDVNRLAALASHFGLPVSRLWCGTREEVQPVQGGAETKRKRARLYLFAAAAALLCIAAALLAALLRPQSAALPAEITFTVDGEAVTAREGDWFVPETPARNGYSFVGWKDGSGREVTFPCKVEGGEAFMPVFEPTEYTIDYWLNGGIFLADAEYTFTVESGALTLPLPEKKGETFEGWYLSPDYAGEAVASISCTGKDVRLYAKWSDTAYTVRYELDGGALYGENPSSITAGEETALSSPVREGYLFLGWYDAPSGGKKYESVGGEGAKNLTLYALWQKTEERFPVYYECDGQPLGENPASVGAGEVHVLFGARKEGYIFLGWNTSPDGSGRYVEALIGQEEPLRLYAVFSPKTYSVRYVYEGNYAGTEQNPNYIVFGERVDLLPVGRYGYEFLGWYDAPEGGNKIERIDESNLLSVTELYARFAPLEYTVTLIAGEGEIVGTHSSGSVYTITFGDELVLPACRLTGYEHLGWNERADGSGTYFRTFTGAEGDQTLYAVYEAKRYLVRYTYEGVYESGKVNPNHIVFGERVELYPVYLAGHEFLGWYDAPEGGNKVERIDESNLLSITELYARFALCEYAVTLDAGEGRFASPEGERSLYTYTLAYGDELVLPVCERIGYVFLGWMNERGEAVEKIGALNIGDMRLTAAWRSSDERYAVKYVLNGGTQAGSNPESVPVGTTAALCAPERAGYLFLGWYDNSDGRGPRYTVLPADRTDDLVLYALWQEIVVSGSAENFKYEKADGKITITEYEGPVGENVDVIIPSFIEGSPVTRIGSGKTGQYGINERVYGIFGMPNEATLRSLTIPEGVLALKENAFSGLTVLQPVQLPSSLVSIGKGAFDGFQGGVLFADAGNLTYIGKSAFHGVLFRGTLVLPQGLKTIDAQAFYNVATTGVIIPDTVEMILDNAFYQPNGYICRMFLPSSVTYLGTGALSGDVYTAFSEAQWEALALKEQRVAAYGVQKSVVTLSGGKALQTLYGEAFDLPSPQREGYTFLGWQDESGAFVPDCYIPNRDAALTAVYEKRTESDGRSLGSAALLAAGTVYEYILLEGQTFYFKPDISRQCRVLIAVSGDFRFNLYRVRSDETEYLQSGEPVEFYAGDVYSLKTGPLSSGEAALIQIVLLPN